MLVIGRARVVVRVVRRRSIDLRRCMIGLVVWWFGGSVVWMMWLDEVASTSFDLKETSATGEKLQVFGAF